MRGLGGLCHQLEVCVRVDIQEVVEGNVRVQGGINAACGCLLYTSDAADEL